MIKEDPAFMRPAGISLEKRSSQPPMSQLLSWPEKNLDRRTDVTERHLKRVNISDKVSSLMEWGTPAEPIGWGNSAVHHNISGLVPLPDRWVTTHQDTFRYYVCDDLEPPPPDWQKESMAPPNQDCDLTVIGKSITAKPPPLPPRNSPRHSPVQSARKTARKKGRKTPKARDTRLAKTRAASTSSAKRRQKKSHPAKKRFESTRTHRKRPKEKRTKGKKLHKRRIAELSEKRKRESRLPKKLEVTKQKLDAEADGGDAVNTRALADGSIASALNLPPFHAYGRKNIRSSSKGRYLSHNIGPDSLPNHATEQQTYEFGYCGGAGANVLNEAGVSNRRNKRKGKKRLSIAELMRDTSVAGRKKLAERKAEMLRQRRAKQRGEKENNGGFGNDDESEEDNHDDEKFLDRFEVEEAEHIHSGILGFELPTEEDRRRRAQEESRQVAEAAERGDAQLSGAYESYRADTALQALQEDGAVGRRHNRGGQVLQATAWQPAQHPDWNPRNYKYLPVAWTKRIRPAGVRCKRSESISNLMNQYS
eukprot:g3611.t1